MKEILKQKLRLRRLDRRRTEKIAEEKLFRDTVQKFNSGSVSHDDMHEFLKARFPRALRWFVFPEPKNYIRHYVV